MLHLEDEVVLMRLELAAKTVAVAFWGAEVVLTAWLKLAEKTVGVTSCDVVL